MDIDNFIKLCNEYFSGELSCEIKSPGGYNKVYFAARREISCANDVLKNINALKKWLAILHHKKGIRYHCYMAVLTAVQEAARKDIDLEAEPKDTTDWQELIRIIIENKHELYCFDLADQQELDSRLNSFALAYLRLENFGIKFIEREYSFFVSEESYSFVNEKIDELCLKVGGTDVLGFTLDILSGLYNSMTGRFMSYRQVSSGLDNICPDVPYGYLFALGAKFISVKGSGGGKEKFDRLVCLIRDLVVIFEIQPYSQFEAMFVTRENFIDFIQENVWYDNLVNFTQIKGSHAAEIIKYVSDELENDQYKSHELKIADVVRVALAIISLSKNKNFIHVNNRQLAKKSRIADYKVKLVMEKILTFSPVDVNSSFTYPPSSMDINYYFKPAISINSKYYIFPKSIAALGCMNSVLNSISMPNGKWSNAMDSALGYKVEDFLRKKFSEKGISFVHGRYVVGSEDECECDLICETNDVVYIFEIKKKGLTRKALAGHDYQLLADLADSFLRSHLQAMRIERLLKDNKTITLVNKNGEFSISLKGRSVDRVSVSLNDFGAFQDKTVMQQILVLATHSEAFNTDKKINSTLNKWREYSAELRELAMKNEEIGVKGKMPFHNSYFVSIPQIMTVLSGSVDADAFFKAFKKFKSVTRGTRDPYKEYLEHELFKKACESAGLTA